MFLFSCCTSGQGQYNYQIRSNHQKISKSNNSQNLQQRINNSNDYVIKVRRSNYEQLLKQNKQTKFTDPIFPPTKQSLGNIPQLLTCNWKRLSDIVSKPILYSNHTKSNQIAKSNLSNCYFLSAISTILQVPKRIQDIFITQQINQIGIYCIKMRINGNIEQIIVDDYVPVNQMGNPIFSAPVDSQICVPLLEKAWAKINGSYANIINGNPSQVFKNFNLAPSEIFFIQDKPQKKEKLWKSMIQANKRKSPICCSTSQNQQISWRNINLNPDFRYTLTYLAQVNNKNNNIYRVLRLKNHLGQPQNWQGQGNIQDKYFWQNIIQSNEKNKLLRQTKQKQGQFIILFNDFIKYFYQINISYQLNQGNFLWQDIYFNDKNGSFWEVNVSHEGQYCFQIHQKSLRNNNQPGIQYNRSTLLLARVNEEKKYQFVTGSMKFTQQDVMVHQKLKPGKYIIYAKIDYQNKQSFLQNKSSLSCYSNKICKFNSIEKKNCQGFLQSLFLNYGRLNKRQSYNGDKMWISWKLLFKQCGFAYIAFGNSKESKKKFSIKFSSKDFQMMNFKLKDPFKVKKGEQERQFDLIVNPGEQKIILARVINNRVTSLKFPPPIQMKIEQI